MASVNKSLIFLGLFLFAIGLRFSFGSLLLVGFLLLLVPALIALFSFLSRPYR